MQPKYEPSPTPAPNEEAPRGPRCFRCLLSETDHTLYETVRAYIDSLSQDEETVGEIRGLAAGYEVLPTRRGCWTAAAGFGRPGLDKAAA